MPAARNAPSRISAASRSSRGRNCGWFWRIVTCAPRRANAWASSQPIGPPPMTASRRGSSVRLKIDSLVRKPASASPGTGGTAGRPPVAITARAKRSRASPTSTSSPERKRASPRKTSIPSSRKRSAPSWGAIAARRLRMRSITAGKSTATGPRTLTPRSPARATSAAARALARTAFDGTQPTFRQSPP